MTGAQHRNLALTRSAPYKACSAFTRVTACTLTLSPYIVNAIRRLQLFRYLHDCSGCFRLERFAGWVLHPLESAALSRRTPGSDIEGFFYVLAAARAIVYGNG
jgi:hypothetical protein